jgi:hypothetical protein
VQASSTWSWNVPYNINSNAAIVIAQADLRIRDTTTGSTLVVGEGQNVYDAIPTTLNGSTLSGPYSLHLSGTFTVSTVTAIQLQHYLGYWVVPAGSVTYNSGNPATSGEDETYAHLTIQKIN